MPGYQENDGIEFGKIDFPRALTQLPELEKQLLEESESTSILVPHLATIHEPHKK